MPAVFITGATKNTGLAIAQKFASEGFDVAISSRKADEAEKCAENLAKEFGIKAKGYALNFYDVEDIKSVFARIRQDFGRLDTFVANAANLGVDMDVLEIDEKQFDDVIDVNLKGTFFCAQQAAKIMKDNNGGAIVFLSSVHSKQCIFGRSMYTASKGGINALSRSLGIELAKYGIRSNAIIAGAIRTERWDGLTDEQIAARRANWPVGLESTGEDIANGVYYLGTDLSKTVTGTELTIDSGILISLLPFKEGNK